MRLPQVGSFRTAHGSLAGPSPFRLYPLSLAPGSRYRPAASGLSLPSRPCGLSPPPSPVFASPPGRGCPVSRHEVWRDFFYSSVFYKSKFFIDFDFYFCKISSWTTGKAGNTAPRGQVPTPTRRTYRLSGREAPSNRGVGAEEAPPQARTRLTRAGIQTAGKTADRPHNGTAGVSSRVTSVAGADGFSVNPATKLEFLTPHQPGTIRAGNGG